MKKTEIRNHVLEKGQFITSDELITVFGKGPLRNLECWCLDSRYRVIDLPTWKDVLAWSAIDKYEYKDDVRDCDNFAMALSGRIPLTFRLNTIGMVIDFSGRHAYNAIITYAEDYTTLDDLIIGVIEPQTDGFVMIGDQLSTHEAYTAEDGIVLWA